MTKTTLLGAILSLAVAAQWAAATDLTGTITLKGTPPKEIDITPLKDDPTCGKMYTSMPTTHFYVVGPNHGLADVVVSLEGISGQSTGASAPPVELDQKGCEYVPQILAVQTGQKIIVKNSDPVLHNVDIQPKPGSGNQPMNQAQLPNGPELTVSFSKPEMFLKFKCDVHPWMFAWVSVFDNPYFAVSGKDGSYRIANVPPGKYTVRVSHRKAGTETKQIEIKAGEPARLDFTLEPKPR